MAPAGNDGIILELAAWQDRLAVVSRNLSEINALPALQRIKARLRAAPDFYVGDTASRVSDAIAALDDLWKDYLLLNALIDQADALRRQSGIFHDHESEIRELLHGRSITLPVARVPLADRDLLASAERADKVTPDELLAAMNALFALAKDTILALEEAETRSRKRLDAILGVAGQLAGRASALGFDATQIAAIASPLEALSAGLTADPLGAATKLTACEDALAAWHAQVESAERERDALTAAFAVAAAHLDELRQLARQAQEAYESRSAKIAGQSVLARPAEPAVIAQFGVWLDALDASRKRGEWRAPRDGLEKWSAACATRLEAERRTLAANRAPLEARDELRGRLKALRAKADAHTARGTDIDAKAAARLADEARDVLYSQPADLQKAAALLSAYEAAINLAIRKTSRATDAPGRGPGKDETT
jgi:hypothetical protein